MASVVLTKSVNFGDQEITFTSGRIARQADGSVEVAIGDNRVHCAAVCKRFVRIDDGVLPLTVNFSAPSYSRGKIPSGFNKRDRRNSDREVLISRLIDRTIRCLMPKGFAHPMQLTVTLLSHDGSSPVDIISLVGSMAAMILAKLPLLDVVAAARVVMFKNDFLLHPTAGQIAESAMDIVVAANQDKVAMIEAQMSEVENSVVLDAIKFAQQHVGPVVELLEELKSASGTDDWSVNNDCDGSAQLREYIAKHYDFDKFRSFNKLEGKRSQSYAIESYDSEFMAKALADNDISEIKIKCELDEQKSNFIRHVVRNEGQRIDGRSFNQVRAIDMSIGYLPKAHGSALFTRGDTQALVVTTLGGKGDEQIVDNIDGTGDSERIMLHYNFPGYSVGDINMRNAPGRREIGHGRLALKGLIPVIADYSAFPYTIRVVSEITESDGSSGMATVCGASLSLMDAGVPIKSAVAGVAMGLFTFDDGHYQIVHDISGTEDCYGDSDFKVAGTLKGITAIQVDFKVPGVGFDILCEMLDEAQISRTRIIELMNGSIGKSNIEIKDHAPRILTFKVDKEKIGEIIGPGGKNIRLISEESGAKIDIAQDGTVSIIAADANASETAKRRVMGSIRNNDRGRDTRRDSGNGGYDNRQRPPRGDGYSRNDYGNRGDFQRDDFQGNGRSDFQSVRSNRPPRFQEQNGRNGNRDDAELEHCDAPVRKKPRFF